MGGAATHSFHTPNARNRGSKDFFPLGVSVEVCTNEEDWKGVFFTGTVISPAKGVSKVCGRKGSKQVCVEYRDLLAKEGTSERLRENIDLACLRPVPPFQEIRECFEPGDVVDALYNDGWWTGFVKSVLEGGRYIVTFKLPPDELEFALADLRVHWDWVDGTWVRHVNQSVAGSMFSVGSSVEVSPNEEDSWDAWFSATILRIEEDGTYLVEYSEANMDSNAEIRQIKVNSSCLRPCPPFLKFENFDLIENVDAFFDSGWWNGVVTKVLEDSRYVVFLKQRKMDKKFHDSELRPHVEWMDGKWYSSSQGFKVVSSDDKVYEHGTDEKLNPSSVKSENGSGCVKDISFFDRIRGYASDSASVSYAQELASVDVNEKSVPPSGSVDKFTCDSSWEMRMFRGRRTKAQATRKKLKSSPLYLKKTTHVPQLEVKKLVSMETPEKVVESKKAGQATEIPVIIGLACAASGSGKMNIGRGIPSLIKHTKTASTDQPNDCKFEKMKEDNKELRDGKSSGKRKRGRPKKVEIGIQTPGTSDLCRENNNTDIVTALGREAIRLTQLDQSNGQHTTKLDPFIDEPLSKWIKAVQSPSKQGDLNREDHHTDMVPVSGNEDGTFAPLDQANAQQHIQDTKNNKLEEESSSIKCVEDDQISDPFNDEPLSKWIASKASSSIISTKQVEIDVVLKKLPIQDTSERDTNNADESMEIQHLPFAKNTFLWRMIQSMEAFKMIPQRPHFKPLEDTKESCREGLAIGCMVTFSSMVERTSKLQFNDPESTINDISETLTELERYGFDVSVIRNRISKLQGLKHEQEKMKHEVDELKSQLLESKNEAGKLEEELTKIDESIEKLQAERSQVKAAQETIFEKIESVSVRNKEVEQEIDTTVSKFGAIASSSWRLL